MAANGFSAVRSHADTTQENRLREHRGAGRGQAPRRRRHRPRDRRPLVVADHGYRRGRAAEPAGRGARRRRRPRRRVPAPRGVHRRRRHRERHRRLARRSPPITAGPSTSTPTRRSIRNANGLDVLAARVLGGFDLGATASHCVSLGQQPLEVQQATAERVAEADISVVVLPHTNLFLQGRGQCPDAAGADRDLRRCARRASTSPPAPTTCRTRSTRSAGPARSRPPA